MALTIPTIKCCNLHLDVLPSVVNLIHDFIPIDLDVFFTNITNLEVISGSFTPNNNTISLASGIPSNSAPNFVILIVDAPVNLTIKSGTTTLLLQNPVNKLYFNVMVANSTYLISDIILDGSTSALVPMTQAVPVNYSLIYGTGTTG